MTQILTGPGFLHPAPQGYTLAPAFGAMTFAATGNKACFIGRVWTQGGAAKSIRRVQFRWGTVTKDGGSALTISLQDVSTTAGPVIRPDETQDQTVAVANADADFVSDTWYRSGVFSADRSVAYGELVAVVFEFDGAGRLGADTISLSSINVSSGVNFPITNQNVSVTKTGAVWAAVAQLQNIILEFSDGTFGTLQGAYPVSAVNSHTGVNTGSTPDEYALKFTPEFTMTIDALWALVQAPTGADYDVVLYEGTTALVTVSIDQNSLANVGARIIVLPITPTDLTAGVDYYIAVKPTTANSVIVFSIDVTDVAFLDLSAGSREATYATRTDAGAWTETTTRRLLAGVQICGVPTSGPSVGLHPIEQGIG